MSNFQWLRNVGDKRQTADNSEDVRTVRRRQRRHTPKGVSSCRCTKRALGEKRNEVPSRKSKSCPNELSWRTQFFPEAGEGWGDLECRLSTQDRGARSRAHWDPWALPARAISFTLRD